jgi:hypothetical protein
MAVRPFLVIFSFLSFLIYSQSIGLLGWRSAPHKVATYTQDNTNTEQTHRDIHASIGIRIHDPSVRAGEDGSCLDRSATLIGMLLRLMTENNGSSMIRWSLVS